MDRSLEPAPTIPVKITSEQSFRPTARSLRNQGHLSEHSTDSSENDVKYLTGEIRVSSVADARIQITGGKSVSGILVLTNYRLKLVVSEKLLNSGY